MIKKLFMLLLLKEEKGESMVESALIISLVGLSCVTALTLLGESMVTIFEEVNSALADIINTF